jgi:hypothetical protein
MIVVGYNAQGSASNQVVIGNSSITQTLLNGSVGLSTSTPWRTLSVVGTMGIQGLTSSSVGNALCITANNEVTTASVASCAGVSSQRFKHEITPTDLGLSTVLNMRPVAFRYNEGYGDSGKDQQFGLIAEDVQKIDQRLIILDGGGLPTAVRYDFLPTILIKAVQELNAKIEAFISNGIATIKSLQVKTENVHLTGQVCVDNGTYNICVTKDQFSQMLLNAGGTVLIPSPTISPTYSSSNIISTPIPTTSPAVTPEATSTPEITPTPSQTPTASTTPSVTPTPEVTPTPSVEPTPTPTLTPSPTVAPDAETPVIL